MADEIIDRVIVAEDGVTVLFREGALSFLPAFFVCGDGLRKDSRKGLLRLDLLADFWYTKNNARTR